MDQSKSTFYVAPVSAQGVSFVYSGKNIQEVNVDFHAKLMESCQARGFVVASDPTAADILINATLLEVDEGSRSMRYLLPFLSGNAIVRAMVEITTAGREGKSKEHVARGGMGFFGGSGSGLIKGCLERIAVEVAGEAAATAKTGIVTEQGPVITYFAIAVPIIAVLTFVCGFLAYNWARGLPKNTNSIKPQEIPTWTAILSLAQFAGLLLAAVASAPTKVLNSTALLWLISISGVKKLSSLRILIGIFAAIAFGIVLLCIKVAPG